MIDWVKNIPIVLSSDELNFLVRGERVTFASFGRFLLSEDKNKEENKIRC